VASPSKSHAKTPGLVLGSSHPKGPQARFAARGAPPTATAFGSRPLTTRAQVLEGPVAKRRGRESGAV
jgi:hypothetical protein